MTRSGCQASGRGSAADNDDQTKCEAPCYRDTEYTKAKAVELKRNASSFSTPRLALDLIRTRQWLAFPSGRRTDGFGRSWRPHRRAGVMMRVAHAASF
eukprot:217622-Rhodomonas_salina.1